MIGGKTVPSGSLQSDIDLELVSEEMASAEADQLIDGRPATGIGDDSCWQRAAMRQDVDEVATESPSVLRRSVRDRPTNSHRLIVLPARSDARRATARRVGTVVGALFALGGLAPILYTISTHVYLGGSDRATAILEGQAMGSGNPLLHGWILTHDSFWTIDAFFYALAVRIGGIWPGLLNLEPALAVTIAVVVGALVASRGHKKGAAVAGAVTAVVLLAFPTNAMASFLLGGPDHVSTAVLALLAFICLRRGGFDWRWAAAVAVLAFGMLGDLLMVAYGIAPVLGAGVVAMLRRREWRAGVAAVTASAAAIIASEIMSWLARAMGAFKSVDGVSVATSAQILMNLRHVLSYGAGLVGFTYDFDAGRVPIVLQDVHVVGALLIVACSLVATANLARGVIRGHRGATGSGTEMEAERWWLDDVLVIAIFGSVLTFVVLAVNGVPGARYLVAAVVFASVLAGRIVAQAWHQLRPGRTTRTICVLGAAVSLWFAAGLGYTFAQPVPVQSASVLASFLEAHHLRNGVGGYWAASITTVESRGVVTVRPVLADPDGELGRYMKLSSADWYAGQHFQFLVYETPVYQGVDSASATKTWGPPAHTYVVGGYHVLVWSNTFRVAPFPPPQDQAQPAGGPSGT
jgi:hypothetical protein